MELKSNCVGQWSHSEYDIAKHSKKPSKGSTQEYMSKRKTIVEKPRAIGKTWREVKALVENKIRQHYFVDGICSQEEYYDDDRFLL